MSNKISQLHYEAAEKTLSYTLRTYNGRVVGQLERRCTIQAGYMTHNLRVEVLRETDGTLVNYETQVERPEGNGWFSTEFSMRFLEADVIPHILLASITQMRSWLEDVTLQIKNAARQDRRKDAKHANP